MEIHYNLKNKITRRLLIKNGVHFSVLAFVSFGFAGRNNVKIEHLQIPFSNIPVTTQVVSL